jgi:hypothetical protein
VVYESSGLMPDANPPLSHAFRLACVSLTVPLESGFRPKGTDFSATFSEFQSYLSFVVIKLPILSVLSLQVQIVRLFPCAVPNLSSSQIEPPFSIVK